MPGYLFLRRLRRSPAAFCGLIIITLLLLTALFAPWLAPLDPNWQDAAARLQGPGARHWLGTDSYGRDLLSRLIFGTRPALGLVALVTAITLPAGLLVGILSGYYGGWLERFIRRFVLLKSDIGFSRWSDRWSSGPAYPATGTYGWRGKRGWHQRRYGYYHRYRF